MLTTVPNAGLPAGFRRKTPNGDARMGAGILYLTPDNRALFVKRSASSDHPGTWAFPGGHVEEDEEPADAARRESMEEVGHLGSWDLAPVHRATRDHVDFTTFAQPVQDAFEPTLNDEHDQHVWAPLSDPPSPLHPGVAALLRKFFEEEAAEPEHQASGAAERLEHEFEGDGTGAIRRMISGVPPKSGVQDGKRFAADRLALDKQSVRSFDEFGRMKVAIANLSKEQIRPYSGKEVPGWEELGLEPDKIYNLFCPGEELRKAAPTFNGIQLLQTHIPVDADDLQMWDIVGTTGTDAKFNGEFLTNSLYVWSQEGIDFIESGERRELSCGYTYDPEMTPGTFKGKKFQGIMRNIKGNHVALVEEGRAGPKCFIADSAIDFQWAAIERAIVEMGETAT